MNDTNHDLDTKKRTTWDEQQALYDKSPLSHLNPAAEDWRRTAQPPYGYAAPASTEASLWCDNCEESMDREGDNPAGVCPVCWNSYLADKAVLEACEALSTDSLREFGKPASTPWVKFAHAELARRGLKP